jgi:hypothetical protein
MITISICLRIHSKFDYITYSLYIVEHCVEMFPEKAKVAPF